MVGWHHRFGEHEFEQTPGESETGKPGLLQSMGLQRVGHDLAIERASLVAQKVKCLPTMRETQVPSLGQENSLEKEMATHSSILVREIPRTEEPGRV